MSSSQRIYCNHKLLLESINLVGFDMDYTLSFYKQEALNTLLIKLATEKLISKNYPKAIGSLHYDQSLAIRGLVIDKRLGNVFKLDQHGHASTVMHGLTTLSKKERHRLYGVRRIQLSSSRYHWIDTLFSLPEVIMYLVLIDFFKDNNNHSFYQQLCVDIRESLDESHKDGTFKSVICNDMTKYIDRDDKMCSMIETMHQSNKKLFLLTNSLFPYTNALMSYLLDTMDMPWHDYFDFIVVGADKPRFFTKKKPFDVVDSGMGENFKHCGSQLSSSVIYQGGNLYDFEKMTGYQGGEILYIGDHIYDDMLLLKKRHTWRTAMVIQELDEEQNKSRQLQKQFLNMEYMAREIRDIVYQIEHQSKKDNDVAKINALKNKLEHLNQKMKTTQDYINRSYNVYWGSLFRANSKNSYFSTQLHAYADLYTCRVSNFSSPSYSFYTDRKKMPHEDE